MTGMREQDAPAYARALPEHDAAAYATDVRTDVLTQKNSLCEGIFRNASRAGGLKEIIDGRGEQNPARVRESGNSSHQTCHAFGAPSKSYNNFSTPAAAVAVRWDAHVQTTKIQNAQSSTGAPLAVTKTAATSPLTRRVQAQQVGALRHHLIVEMACSPVARWHGESDGSDPLRPSQLPTAGRCKDDRASAPILRSRSDNDAAVENAVAVAS